MCPSWTGPGFESGQTLLVEVLEDETWVVKRTYARLTWGCFELDPTVLVPGPGTYSFRGSSRVPSTGDVLTTAEAAFTLRKDDGRIVWLDASRDFEPAVGWMGFGVRLDMRKPKNLITRVSISYAHGQVVELQRKSGSRWLTVSSAKAPPSGDGVTVKIKIPARAGMSTHRFMSRATAWSPTVRTGSFTVYQSAGLTRSSYIAEARDYMARYCPQTPISIDTPAVRTGSQAGRASASVESSGGVSVLHTQIELRSGMWPDKLRSVALHECAHIVQYRSVVDGRSDEVAKRAAELWPRFGVEGQADCMSYQITRDPNWFGYVRGCSKEQLRNAATMWRTYGGKYQAAAYRW